MTKEDEKFFEIAAEEALKSTCSRAHCGSVIVKDGEIIGRGYNSPPLDKESARFCDMEWDYGKKPKYDLTCCVHAEWRAMIDANKNHPDKIEGSRLYFMRVDEDGNFTDAGVPFCTVCSRASMDSGIAEFVLWSENTAKVYAADSYNRKSYEFYKLKIPPTPKR